MKQQQQKLVFVIRDFEVDGYVGLALQYLAGSPPDGLTLDVPGIPGAAEQGRLLEDVINPAITRSQYVICFLDTPNANVGYELGFALGSGRRVALVCASSEKPAWLERPPLGGYLINLAVQLPKLQQIMEKQEYVEVTAEPEAGGDVLFLAPREGEGLVGHDLVSRFYPSWRTPEETGWTLDDLPQKLKRIGEVVWLITPYAPGSDRKDGSGNSLNAIVAGYAAGKNIPLRVLRSEHHRKLADVERIAYRFKILDELRALLKEAEKMRSYRAVGSETASPEPADSLERIVSGHKFRSVELVKRLATVARSVGRISVGGEFFATTFLLSRSHVLTPQHVVADVETAEQCTVTFQREETGSRAVHRRVKTLSWTSHPSLDASVLELSSPLDEPDLVLPLAGYQRAPPEPVGPVYVVGYPRGGTLSISFSNEAVLTFDQTRIHYRTPTEMGSSGSAVFDSDLNLIAMHHAGGHMPRLGGQGEHQANEGIRISAILAAFKKETDIWPKLASEFDQLPRGIGETSPTQRIIVPGDS